jgi:RNA recognition motif-containing protein
MASKLYIGGLSYSTTSDGLKEFFSQSGNVLSATVITDRFSGQSRGFGFVEMAAAEEAQNAISQLNGRELDGRRITVEISNPQAPRSGGPGGGGGRPGGGGGRPGGGRPAVVAPAAVAAAAKAATPTGPANRSSGSALNHHSASKRKRASPKAGPFSFGATGSTSRHHRRQG